MEASVADVVAFESLPDEVQELAKRVLGPSDPGGSVVDAYEAGWEDCADEMSHPMCPGRDRIVDTLKRRAKK